MMLTYVRSAKAVVLGPIITAGVCTSLIVVTRFRPDGQAADNILRWWGTTLLRIFDVDLVIESEMEFDPDQSYVVVSNHQSNLDIMANFVAAEVPIRFMAKSELFRIPIFGQAIRGLGMVEVDRKAGASRHMRMNAAAKAVTSRKHSLMVYPEGTRSRDGSTHTFKKGGFLIAIEGQLPVVPMTISGAEHAWPTGGLMYGGTVHIHVGPEISTKGMTMADVADLTKRTQEVIEATRQRLSLSAG
jgi:1-acyl-sn-glycerol-3-phosphate acyltransferase